MTTILGTTVGGRYRLEAKIGMGGMSTVYRAFDEILQRRVAIKLMNREVATDSDQLERFRREARAVAQLSHPHIVGVIDAGEDDGRPYIVLEFVEGATLKERIRSQGRLPIPEAVAYAIEIARALGAAHVRHIVHRDVKPQNVLLDGEGRSKVTDFGIARTLDEEGLTAAGRVLGTTDYVSPEQALGHDVTGQSDIYSLGVVLYEMLVGDVPFKGENQVAVAMKHVRERMPDVQAKRPQVSATLAAVVERATAKAVADRYRDDVELVADLEEVLAIETARAGSATGEVTSVIRTLPEDAQRRVPFWIRRRLAAGLLVVLLVGVGIGLLAWLSTRAHHGTGSLAQSPPTAHTVPVGLCQTCAHDYNPLAMGADKSQHPYQVGDAIDRIPSTAWTTEQYYNGLQKAGVGLYVTANPAVRASEMVIDTSTPGFAVTIYARNTPPSPDRFDVGPSGWVKVGSTPAVAATQSIALAASTTYRYYLVWITGLGHHNQVALNEVALYRLSP